MAVPTIGNRTRAALRLVLLAFALASLSSEVPAMDDTPLRACLTPEPQQLAIEAGHLPLRGASFEVSLPAGPQHEASRDAVTAALRLADASIVSTMQSAGDSFAVGEAPKLPPLPERGCAQQGYVLSVSPRGVAAAAASPAGLLYAAQTLRQLLRLSGGDGRVRCLSITDYPEFRLRGIYIEGGQERFGHIVDKDYLLEQIRRLAEFKMNALVIECYNLFPYESFPSCADEATLSPNDCRQIVAESKRYHVTIIPSLQTLAQAFELVWNCEEGGPYREPTAPGLMCPSTPEIYPFIKGLYRDLLTLFDDSPIMGIGCSEIDMQWKGRYCPKCQARIDAGETVRDLLLGHAEKCIDAVAELSAELGRPIRPMMWADEFYMYGPGKDWVGIERIPETTIMGHWKYWRDYAGIDGLMQRGYDVFGISAMYNHCVYLADLSPEDPPKLWPPLEHTGILNITEMARAADAAQRAHPDQQMWGIAAASFSKHRLRAFDSIWYGFVLNGHCTWSRPQRPVQDYQWSFTRAFTRHYYDARSDQAADALAAAYERLDEFKSQLERANQTLHDIVGVHDTQEPGYIGNTLLGACRNCRELIVPDGEPDQALVTIKGRATRIVEEAAEVMDIIDAQRPRVGRVRQLGHLWLAAEKIAAHAERQVLMIDMQQALARAPDLPAARRTEKVAALNRRWAAHRQRVERILRRTDHLYSRGDACGLSALLRDMRIIETHLERVAQARSDVSEGEAAQVLIEERFDTLDSDRWIVLGNPELADGALTTRAPGGWGKYCGIMTRQQFGLEDERPLIVEFDLTPLEMGVDSQLFVSATAEGDVAHHFSFYGPRNRFGVYTQCTAEPEGNWIDSSPGWHLRAQSHDITLSSTYHIRAYITRRTFRVVVSEPSQTRWELPFWDTGQVPMDEVAQVRLMFADVEPENSQGASRWGAVTIYRPGEPPIFAPVSHVPALQGPP